MTASSVILPDGVDSWHDCYEIYFDHERGYDRALLLRDVVIRGLSCPAGYEFEASIPTLARGLIGHPAKREFLLAACYHDRRYDLKQGSRKHADDVFKDLLLEEGVDEGCAQLMWAAVRAFGHYASDWWDEADLAAQAAQRAYETAIDESLSV